MNTSEGIRCLEIAKKALSNKKYDRACQLAEKALRLLSDAPIEYKDSANYVIKTSKYLNNKDDEVFSDKLNHNVHKNTKANSSNVSHETDAKGKKSKNYSETGFLDQSENSQPEEFTHLNSSELKELEIKCKAIINDTDYYRILDVSRDANQDDIKKAFRKLALVFHPDKMRCPSAAQAFKKIAEAYQCFANPQSKQHYDSFGYQPNQGCQRNNADATFISPEDLIASLFGIHFPSSQNYSRQRVYRVSRNNFRYENRSRTVEPQSGYSYLQILPLIILILISVISNFLYTPNTSPYSFMSTSQYNVLRHTQEHHVPYYVRNTFLKYYPERSNALNNLDIKVEINYFIMECKKEQYQLNKELENIRLYGSREQYFKKLEELRKNQEKSVSCKTYKYLVEKYPYHNFQE